MIGTLRQALTGDWHPFAALALNESYWRHSKGAVDTTRVTSAAPVLLISGGLDPATPPEMADSAALGLPNSTKFIDSTAGHGMFYENQVAAITSFILR